MERKWTIKQRIIIWIYNIITGAQEIIRYTGFTIYFTKVVFEIIHLIGQRNTEGTIYGLESVNWKCNVFVPIFFRMACDI